MKRIIGLVAALALGACETPQQSPASPAPTAVAPMPPAPGSPAMQEVFDGKAMRLILCGTSSPLPDPNRAKACTIVVAGDKAYVVDTGPESWEELARMQFPGARIAGIFLTHYHSDHIGDLGEFRMQTMVAGRQKPLAVYGAHGIKDIVAGFNQAYAEDARLRLAHHGAGVVDLKDSPLEAHEFGKNFVGKMTASEVILQDGDLKVTAFEVNHDPIRPAVGYRFDWKGRSIVISGDTAKVDNLVNNAKGADLLVCESLAANLVALAKQQAGAQNNPRIAKVMGDIPSYHVSPIDAAKMANDAGVKLLVYTHHIPSVQVGSPLYFQGVADVRPAAKWVAGWDGFRVDLPVGSDEVKQGELLPKP